MALGYAMLSKELLAQALALPEGSVIHDVVNAGDDGVPPHCIRLEIEHPDIELSPADRDDHAALNPKFRRVGRSPGYAFDGWK